jgi:UDP-N-acetyl-D-glucosamine dehydrogenase
LSIQFGRSGVNVLGLDIDPVKVNALNEGRSYIKHIASETVIELRRAGRFFASTDFSLVKHVGAVLICAPTLKRRTRVYIELLDILSELRSQGETWIALPSEVAAW